MLASLNIDNYILISKLEIEFDKQLNIITGETGSGKSILLGALGLIKGNRLDTDVFFDKTKKCVIEATFHIASYKLEYFFALNELDFDVNTIIRREISPNGKSRAFINDTPVSLAILKELTSTLIDIHSQNNSLLLNRYDFQLSLVDQFAQNKDLLNDYQQDFKTYLDLKRRLSILINEDEANKKDYDYNLYLYNELQDINFTKEEFEFLEKEAETLEHSEEIGLAISKSIYLLDENEHSVYNAMINVNSTLAKVESFNANIKSVNERILSQINELKDIAADINSLASNLNSDPGRLDDINNKLNLIYTLQKKHRLNDFEELIQLRSELRTKIDSVDNLAENINKIEIQLNTIKEKLTKKAKDISEKRKKAFKQIENKVKETVATLGMPNAEFVINHELSDEITECGIDKIQFLFNANKGGIVREVNKVASGGEISRLMLSLKSLISEKNLIPTIIFDEIDTGISGKIADQTGKLLCDMSNNMQVIAITHSPQIAAKGNAHFMVYKSDIDEKTYTQIKKLTQEERISHIAQMLSGENVSEEAISNAKTLINTKL